ncbi:MAG: nitroreductase [Gammaproteobacteria bacterium]|nr:nitroreductase [Gammaproteobacteria bacterium]
MACAAPSAGDLQSYRIVVVRDRERRRRLRALAHDQPFVSEAPVCLVFCADGLRAAERFGARGAQLYALQDATIAAAYAQLAIVAAGMGSTWIGNFDDAGMSAMFELDPEVRPVAMLSVGYPAELPDLTPRRRLEELVIYR